MTSQEFKRYERFKEEAQFLRSECQHLRREVDTYRPAWYRSSVRIDLLEQRVAKLTAENRLLKQKVKDLTPTRIQIVGTAHRRTPGNGPATHPPGPPPKAKRLEKWNLTIGSSIVVSKQ